LGPGLIESIYEACLFHEIEKQGIKAERQRILPIRYKDTTIDAALRIDLFVEGRIVVELKAVEKLLPVHEAQILTYLKLTGCRLGLLFNFNVPILKEGIKRIIL
jgi:GxxExxY protein